MNNKTNETLTEIMHLAAAALIARDPGIERIALGDIAEVLAKAMPPADGRADCPHSAAPTAPTAAPQPYKRNRIGYCDGAVLSIEKGNRKLVGVITRTDESFDDETYPYKYFAEVFEGKELLFSIDSCRRGKAFFEHALRGALKGAVLQLTHAQRVRANRNAARKAAPAARAAKKES